jgi:hypothetical protein
MGLLTRLKWWLVQKLGGEKPGSNAVIFVPDGVHTFYKADGARVAQAVKDMQDRWVKEGKIT